MSRKKIQVRCRHGCRASSLSQRVDEVIYLLRAFLDTDAEARRSPHPRVELEIAAVRTTRRRAPQALDTLLAKVEDALARFRHSRGRRLRGARGRRGAGESYRASGAGRAGPSAPCPSACRSREPTARALKVLMIAVAAVAMVLVYAVFRDLTDELKAALVVLATATSPAIVYYTQSVMTELPFLCLSLLAIWWIQRSARRTGWTVSAIIVAALLVSLVFLTRMIGVSLLLAAVLAVVFDGTGKVLARIRTALVLGAVAAVPLSLWLLYSSSASVGGIPYVQHYRSSLGLASDPSGIETAGVLLVKVLAALYAYCLHIGRLIFYWLPSSRAGNMLALLLSAVVFAGFLYRVIRERTVVEYYVFLYVCALLVYPGSRQQRYMVPLIPFFWLYFLTALDELRRRLWSRPDRGRVMAMGVRAVVICLLIVNATTSVLMNVVRGGRGYYEPVTPDKFRDALSWVQENTPADSVFMWAKPSLGYVLADRKAVKIPRATPRMLLRTLRERNVDYVVVHPSWKAAQFLERLVEEHPEHLTLVHRAGGVRVYRVDRPAA